MFPTYWNAEVSVDGACKMSTGALLLNESIERALTDAIYYQAIYPQGRVEITANESCARCHNLGEVTIRRPRSCKTIRCPACKGKLATGKLDAIELVMPDPANKITLAQSA